MIVIKRDGSQEEFNRAKIKNALMGALQSVNKLDEEKIKSVATDLSESISVRDGEVGQPRSSHREIYFYSFPPHDGEVLSLLLY